MHYSSSPSQIYPQNLSQSIFIPRNSPYTQKQLHAQQTKHYHKLALESFPFGKQSIKLSQYVSSKMNSKDQDDNARILQEFRRKAIEDKFTNKYGHLRSSKIMHRYITENMLPGVTVNPSMVANLQPELKHYPQQMYNPSSQYQNTHYNQQPLKVNYTTIDSSQLYNTRQQPTYPQQSYNSATISYTQSPQKLHTECQTQVSSVKSYKQIDLQRKYYKMKCKQSRHQLRKFDKVQKMLQSLNKEVRQNSRFLQNAIMENHENHDERMVPRKGKSFSVRSDLYREDKSQQHTVKYPRPRIKTEMKGDEQVYQNWKLNNQMLYNSTHSSINAKKLQQRPKPKVKYTLNPQTSANRLQDYSSYDTTKSNSRKSNYQMGSSYKMKDRGQNQKSGVQRIREHLKLLKRHAQRLETVNSYSLAK